MKHVVRQGYIRALLGATILLAVVVCLIATIASGELKAENYSACAADGDCVLVAQGYCGGNTAINSGNLDTWDRRLQLQRRFTRLLRPHLMCAPSLPREAFEARCLQGFCRALLRQERIFLEFSAKPLLDTPVTLELHYRVADDVSSARAGIEIVAPGLEVIDGSAVWQGSLRAGEDGVAQLHVVATEAGYYQVKGALEYERDGQHVRLEDVVNVEVDSTGATFGSTPVNHWGSEGFLLVPGAFELIDDDLGLIDSQLTISSQPKRGQEATLVYRVTPQVDLGENPVVMQVSLPLQGTEIQGGLRRTYALKGWKVIEVTYPAGGQSSSDHLTVAWQGPLASGQTAEIKVTFRITEYGWGKVTGHVFFQPAGGSGQNLQASSALELHVDEHRSYVVPVQ